MVAILIAPMLAQEDRARVLFLLVIVGSPILGDAGLI